jgi:hypothetical protein
MRPFDPEQPLIFIHVPKTAGVSVRSIFEAWFPEQLRLHYYNEVAGLMPERLDLEAETAQGAPPVIYGHFNRKRDFGIQQYYPEVQQFVTVLRDPVEMHISRYFYTNQELQRNAWKTAPDVAALGVVEHVKTGHLNMLEHFPRPVTFDNYKDMIDEYFIDIACVKTLDSGLRRIATRLGKPAQSIDLPHLNATPRNFGITDRDREEFREKWPLEHAVYAYAESMSA